jgi:uncharacterized damage-inducible protein DinB
METNSTLNPETAATPSVITAEILLNHWQGHRRLTRRVIEAFPEEQFYNFSIGGMRTYAGLTMEMIGLAAPGVKGIATGNWTFDEPRLDYATEAPATKKEVLELWDMVTDIINDFWSKIPEGRFQESEAAFGMYEGKLYDLTLYLIDNEIHHRAQGYVYLRALGVEPPAFWDRN